LQIGDEHEPDSSQPDCHQYDYAKRSEEADAKAATVIGTISKGILGT
jgi:hypothetical protein